MSGGLSKRQQARNEKALQDLVCNVPGNNQCADCHARNPAWASWSLGVFLCLRCAAIHRKLGTHVSKIKSLSMDSWSNEQVDNMRKVGNVASNQIYNAEGRKPPVPIDADEADSAMERFIRQKYIHNVVSDSKGTRSPASDEGTPPPLPPKNSTKFGFRAATSIFPLSSRAKKEQRAAKDSYNSTVASNVLPNKPSRLFGSSVDHNGPDDWDKKLFRLREMGFQDNQRNGIVLKGVNGSLDRAVEALVRLGVDRSRSPASTLPTREPALRTSRSMTPLDSSSGSSSLGLSLNSSIRSMPDRPATSSTTSTNPFDSVNVAQPQTAHSTGSLHHKNPYSGGSNNPFMNSSQHTDPIGEGPQELSAPPQPKYSHQAHGQAIAQPSPPPLTSQQHHQLQSYTAATTTSGSQHYPLSTFQSNMTNARPSVSAQQPMQAGFNTFVPQPPHSISTQGSLAMHATPAFTGGNPFLRAPTRIASPTLGQIPEQAQPILSQSPFFGTTTQSLPAAVNPFGSSNYPQFQQHMPQLHATQFGQQSFAFQQTNLPQPRYDKAAILALYNQPSQSQHRVGAADSHLDTNIPSIPEDQASYVQSSQLGTGVGQQPRSLSRPALGSTNPYVNQTISQPNVFNGKRHISRESMNLGLDMAWTNGRHSPDAFASLSARHV